jgi:hypothetical protein
MRYARRFLYAVALAGSLGMAGAALDIVRAGQVSGKMSLTVGTALDVDGVDGQFLLVHIHLLKGRVPAKDTDLGVQDPAALAAAQAAAVSVPTPAAQQLGKPTPIQPRTAGPAAPLAARPAIATPTPTVRPVLLIPVEATRASVNRPSAKIGQVTLIAMLSLYLVTIVSYWRLFTMAGKPGWAILVPIYNMIIWQQVSGKPLWWILLYFVPVVNLVICVMCMFAFAEKFGKGKAFAAGLLLLPWIFLPILAFGGSEYLGTPVDPAPEMVVEPGA